MAIESYQPRIDSIRDALLQPQREVVDIKMALDDLQSFIPMDKYRRLSHLARAKCYSPSGNYSKWGWRTDRARAQAEVLIKSKILPEPKGEEKVVILSPSANASGAEFIMQKVLGNKYVVIASDLEDVARVDNSIRPLRADASFLPFPDESVNVIYDWLGALWYEAHTANRNRNEDVPLLFQEYSRVLKKGGIIVVDAGTGNKVNLIGIKDLSAMFSEKDIKVGDANMKIYRKRT